MTRQKALILEIMSQQRPAHLTADEIFCHARQQMPHIARGTVYRNLKLMERDGEVAPHGHLLCDGCGELTDLPVVGLIREVEAAIGTEVRGYTLTIHYLCPKCRAKQAQ